MGFVKYISWSAYLQTPSDRPRTQASENQIKMGSSDDIMQLITRDLFLSSMIRFGTDDLTTCAFNPTLPKDKMPVVLAIASASSEPTRWRLSRTGLAEFSFA